MTISDIELEMKFNGVGEADIASILTACKAKGYGPETLDKELVKRGYDKIFTVDYDDEADMWEEDDEEDDFAPIERFPHKQRFDDDRSR